MRTDYVPKELLTRLLEALTPQNALVMELCMVTGMRVGDALMVTDESARSLAARKRKTVRYKYTEKKTGKERTVSVPRELFERALEQHRPESPWLFSGVDPQKHRTRQAVWKDLHRAAKLYRVNGKRLRARIGPHTARKVYAVDLYRKTAKKGIEDPLEAVKANLNHTDLAVTYIYALADEITARKSRTKSSRAG